MRSYNDPIEVRRGLVCGLEAPAQFLWRNRLWVVRDVQNRWVETGAWWDGPSARALRGTDSRSGRGDAEEVEADLLAEEEVWRVVAANGRAGHQGVYELSHVWGTGQWRLRTVMD
ncbi:hypothetical protein GCM10009841_16290 [Microlunatus panaciterrae]|uniref:DUF6504 domain-containing protein n=1 Tax=Microlunatus panaciterrae TaxID=400768 RepID=A0ABS2RNP5_9ACTN|nr:DUF6504 family protein [Microlunatus panaciterrae]MBM7800187.1 hypothetical protein [Microlunatus panaciterrae]